MPNSENAKVMRCQRDQFTTRFRVFHDLRGRSIEMRKGNEIEIFEYRTEREIDLDLAFGNWDGAQELESKE